MKKISLLLLILLISTSQTVFAKVKNVCKPVYMVEQGVNKGYQVVKCGKTYGAKTSFSHVAVPPEYSTLKIVNDDFLKVKQNKKYGLINYYNKVVIPAIYDDVQVAEVTLKHEKPIYVFLAKKDRKWFILDDGEVKYQLLKSYQNKNALKTELRILPHKVERNGIKCWTQRGTLNMGELLYGTPIASYIPTKLPKWTLTQITENGLIKIFTANDLGLNSDLR